MATGFITTADGSDTLYSTQYADHYHSLGGALSEAMYIYIQCGLHEVMNHKTYIRILDVGFGTGLNALCTYVEALMNNLNIFYTAVEPCPIDIRIAKKLNYCDFFKNTECKSIFMGFHQADTDKLHKPDRNFTFKKFHQKIQDTVLSDNYFDLVYFDPFKPSTHRELWGQEIFLKLFKAMTNEGVLLTYSSGVSAGNAMREAGLKTEKLPGPGNKREITRARKFTPKSKLLTNAEKN